MILSLLAAMTLLAADAVPDLNEDGPVPSIVGWYAWLSDVNGHKSHTGKCLKLSARDAAHFNPPTPPVGKATKTAFSCRNTHGGSGVKIVVCMTPDERHVLAALATKKQCQDEREDEEANE